MSQQYQNALSAWGRSQDMDYMARFRPREDFLISYATDTGLAGREADRAAGVVNRAFDDAPGIAERQFSRLGITQTQEQKDAAARSSAHHRGLAEIDARNRASTSTVERQRSILFGGLS